MSLAPHVPAPLAAVAVALLGCSGPGTPEIAAGIDSCEQCGMLIDRPGQACGYERDGRFVTFDSPVCLLRSYEALRRGGKRLPTDIHFADYEEGALYPAAAVTFLLTDHLPTVMESDALCFGSREAAERVRAHADEIITDWEGFRLARGEPDRVIEVSVGPGGMTPSVVSAERGELLLWRVRGRGLDGDLVLSIRGFPELAAVTLPASGEVVVFRQWASRPGAGFPVVGGKGGEPLGMLKVSGAHTADEEAM